MTTELRVATFNIGCSSYSAGVHGDGRTFSCEGQTQRVREIAESIFNTKADLICLQGCSKDMFRALEKTSSGFKGYHTNHDGLDSKREEGGCAIFYNSDTTAYLNVRSCAKGVRSGTPRRDLFVEVSKLGQAYRVGTGHLEEGARGDHQLVEMIRYLKEEKTGVGGPIIVLAGDFGVDIYGRPRDPRFGSLSREGLSYVVSPAVEFIGPVVYGGYTQQADPSGYYPPNGFDERFSSFPQSREGEVASSAGVYQGSISYQRQEQQTEGSYAHLGWIESLIDTVKGSDNPDLGVFTERLQAYYREQYDILISQGCSSEQIVQRHRWQYPKVLKAYERRLQEREHTSYQQVRMQADQYPQVLEDHELRQPVDGYASYQDQQVDQREQPPLTSAPSENTSSNDEYGNNLHIQRVIIDNSGAWCDVEGFIERLKGFYKIELGYTDETIAKDKQVQKMFYQDIETYKKLLAERKKRPQGREGASEEKSSCVVM